MKWDKAKYSPTQGWIKMVATLTRATALSEAQAKSACTLGKPNGYEFGPWEQRGKQLSIILRDKSKEANHG